MAETVAAQGYAVEGFLVQRMVGDGVELLVGVVHDASFGPVVACGAGGTAVELLKDVAVRITPLTDRDAAEMVRSLQTFPLLDGYRGAPKGDVAALEELLLRVSALVDAHPTIAELDCNPVRVLPEGVVVVDARVRIEPAAPSLPLGARRR
jgi:acyl-CoA synthetase (NDP forming)